MQVMCRVVLTSTKLGQSWIENLLQQRFLVHHSRKGKETETQNVAHSLRDRENLQNILERKVNLAVRGERGAQQKLYQADAEVEARNWEKRYSDFAF